MKRKLLSCLLALALLLTTAVPAFAAETAPPAADGADIRVMGWNLLNNPGMIPNWEEYFTVNKRGARTVEIIGHYDADSIGFQEGNLNWKNYLNVNLTDYTIVPASMNSTDPIYYRQDRMELIDSGVFWLSATPDVPSKAEGAAEERVCTWAILRNRSTGVTYAHFNTHLDHVSDEARTVGMQVIRDKMEDFREATGYADLGMVATGDFNSNRSTDAYRVMVADHPNVNMKDSLYCAPQDAQHIINEGATLIDGNLMIAEDLSSYDGGLAIDHVFASIDVLDVQSYQVIREGDKDNPRLAASDHFGLYVQLNTGAGQVRRHDTELRETAAFGAAAVDGVKDDAYSASSSGIVDSATPNGGITLPKGEMTTASYSFTHDQNFLYYFIDVTDHHVTDADRHVGENGEKNAIDGIEIYYNFLKGSSNPKEYTSDTMANGEAGYFSVYANNDPITYNSSKVSADTAAVLGQYVARHTETGYVVEGKIPLSASVRARLNGKDDICVGMGFLLSDDADNGAGGRDYYIVNTGNGDVLSAWSNPAATLPLWLAPNETPIVPGGAAYGTPVLDGTLDEAYGNSDVGTIANATFSGATQVPDGEVTRATYRFAYDSDRLYYFIEVTDRHVTDADKHTGEDGNQNAIDGVEIYYNFLKGTTNPTAYTSETAANGDAGYFSVYANGDPASNGFDYVARHTDTGYVVEGAIPLSQSMKAQLAGASGPVEMGTGFIINDDTDNGAGGRDYYIVNEDQVLAAWSNPSRTTSLYLVPKKDAVVPNGIAYGTPTIDGGRDDLYDRSYAGTFTFNGQNTTDTNGAYRYLYDDRYLYYYIEITDANVNRPETVSTEANGNGIDGAQLYFNFARSTNDSASYDSELVSNGEAGFFTIFPNGNPAHNQQYAAANPGVYSAVKDYGHVYTETGYALEGKIPLSDSLRAKLSAGGVTAIGLGIQLNDDADDDGVRDNYLFSAPVVGEAWGNPSKMQEFYLLPKPDDAEEQVYGNAIDRSVQRAAYGTAAIDGTLDDGYLSSTPDTFHYNGGNSDANGVYRFLHDDDYLYFFVDIADSTVDSLDTADQQSDHNGIDGIQLYYDFLNTDYFSAGNADKYSYYTWSYCNQNGNEAGYFGMFANNKQPIWLEQGSAEGIEYTAVHTEGGYAIEGKVPLSESLKAKLAGNLEATIGFGLQLNDDTNDDGYRDNYVMSQEKILSAWSRPYSMTDLLLEPNYFAASGASARAAAYGTPKIDGKLDEVYGRAPTIPLDKEIDTNHVTAGGATGSAKAVYDEGYLYLFTEIQDSTLNSTSTHPKDENVGLDGVQFYLDFTDGAGASFTPGMSGYLILDVNDYDTTLQDGTPVERWGGSGKLASVYKDNPEKCSWKAVRTDNGYNIEVRFALPDEVRAKLAADGTANIGVGFQINDDADDDGVRDHIAFSNGRLATAWSNPGRIERMTLLRDYRVRTNFTAEQGTLKKTSAYAGELVTPEIAVAEGLMLVESSLKLDGRPFEPGSSFVMPAQDVELTAEIVEKPDEFPIVLPQIEGLTITCDRQTAKPGELVTLDVQLDDGYVFVQDDGMYDFGHFSVSQQKWVSFSSGPYGLYLMGRRLKMNGQSLIWDGSTFVMPDGEAVITAEVEESPIANAVRKTVRLDGVKDEAYDGSRTINVNRSTSSATRYEPGGDRAVGTINTAYDDDYLYCFAEINDPTRSTTDALTSDVNTAKSLFGFDNIVFFFDFLNTDDANTATNEYRFVDGESGIFLIDALNLQQSIDGRIYDKLGGGFASYNGDKSKADYVVVQTETGYCVELKIALSDSLKAKLASSSADDRPEIGIGAIIVDDQNNNGGWDYENSDKVVCSDGLVTNMWYALQFVRTADDHIQVSADVSPRWLGRLTLDYGAPAEQSLCGLIRQSVTVLRNALTKLFDCGFWKQILHSFGIDRIRCDSKESVPAGRMNVTPVAAGRERTAAARLRPQAARFQ